MYGLSQVVVSKKTGDIFNPKVVRSTMGAIFRVKIIECEDLKKTLKEIKKHKFKIVVSSLQTENTIYDINYYKKVIIIGNEANGVEQQIQEIADEKIKIPMIRKNRKLKCISSNRNYFVWICETEGTGLKCPMNFVESYKIINNTKKDINWHENGTF